MPIFWNHNELASNEHLRAVVAIVWYHGLIYAQRLVKNYKLYQTFIQTSVERSNFCHFVALFEVVTISATWK